MFPESLLDDPQVEELEAGMARLSREKDELLLSQKRHEEEATIALQGELQHVHLQNQELHNRVRLVDKTTA